MAQRNIDFGTFPNDPDADAIRTAFDKVQQNFTELFSGLGEQAVFSVSGLPGGGITAFPTVGNVVLAANLACLQVRTSTLSIGRDANGSQSAVITQSSQELVVDLPANIVNVANANFSGTVYSNAFVANNSISSSNTITATGNITAGNLTTSGVLVVTSNANVGNIGATSGVFTANISVANNISATNVWANSGTINAANANIVGNIVSGNANLGNLAVANFFSGNGSLLTGVIAAPGNIILNSNSNVSIPTSNSSVFVSVAGTANVLVISQTGINANGTANFNGNLSATNANLGNAASANYFIGNFYGTANSATTATTAGTVTTAAQGNITSVGTLTGLGVNGTITGVNITANTGVFTGNGSGLSAIAGANVTGTVSAATTAGTVTTAAQPNITSVGTLTSLGVSGTVTAPAFTANTGVFTGNANGLTNIPGANVTGTVANATAATTAGTVTTAAQPNITSVGTLGNLTVSGNVTISSGELKVNNDIIISRPDGRLVFVSSDGTSNGMYIERSTADSQNWIEFSSANSLNDLLRWGIPGLRVYSNVGSSPTLSFTANAAGVTTTNVAATGNITAANITANTGLFTGNGSGLSAIAGANVTGAVAFATTANAVTGANVSGQVANALVAGTVYTAAQPNITSVGTLTGLTVGNATANVVFGNGTITLNSGLITGNGNGLSSLQAANVTGTLPTSVTNAISNVGTITAGTWNSAFTAGLNANTLANIQGANVSGAVASATTATTAGTVTTNAQPNITSVGTLTSLAVTGNLSSGNANLGNLAAANFFQGDGSLLTNITVAAGSFITNGTSNVIVDASGNVRTSVVGNANILVVTGTGANISGYANVTGNVLATGVYATLLDGTLTNASNAQPNITSVGTLTGLTVNGTSNLGPNSNVIITGGVNGAFLKTNGSGDLTWDTGTLSPAQGTNTQVIFNDGGTVYAGNSNLTFNKATGNLSVGGGLTVTNSATFGNVFANSGTVRGSLLTGTLTTAAQPNVTSLGTLTGLIVNGNINAGNVSGGNLVTANFVTGTLTTAAQPNITSLGTLTALGVNNTITAVNLTANTGVFTGNANGLNNIPGANVSGTVANATFATSAGSATTAGTVTTNAQPNITSVGSLTSLIVSGNAIAGNVYSNSGTIGASLLTGTLTTAAQPNITSVGTLTTLGVNNTVTAVAFTANTGVFTGNGSALTALNASNISSGTLTQARLANSNVILGNTTLALGTTTTTIAGLSSVTSTTFVGALTGAATTAGTVTTNAQPNITSVGTLTSLGVNNTVTAVAFTANTGVFTGNGSGLSAVAGANVSGAVAFATTANAVAGANVSGAVAFATTANAVAGANVSGTVANATFATSAGSATTAGTVTTNAQPNITSTGTLTSLTVSGNITAQANVNMTGYVIRSVGTGISAAGSTQGTATAITKEMNVVSTVASGAGVVLPTAVAGMVISITNTSANSLLVYPAVNGIVNSQSANAAYSQSAGSTLQFIAPTTTQWYTVGATFA